MTTKSTKAYVGVPRDVLANFGGRQLVYVSWDQHLLFAAPFLLCLAPETPFRAMMEGPLTALLAPDPDAAVIDWSKAEWRKGGLPWTPDFDRTLAENGVAHKTLLRFRTPELNTLLDAGAAA